MQTILNGVLDAVRRGDLAGALTDLATLSAAGAAAWLALASAVEAAALARGSRAGAVIRVLRRAFGTGLLTTAVATGFGMSGAHATDTLPSPDRAVAGIPASKSATHVVQQGDSLWTITSTFTRADTPAETADGMRALYAANRSVIGDDPDLIHPGARLVVPRPLLEGPRP